MNYRDLDALIKEIKGENCNLERLSLGFESRLRTRLSQRCNVSHAAIRFAILSVAIYVGIFTWLKISQHHEEQFYTDFGEAFLADYENEIIEHEMGDWLWSDDL